MKVIGKRLKRKGERGKDRFTYYVLGITKKGNMTRHSVAPERSDKVPLGYRPESRGQFRNGWLEAYNDNFMCVT